MNFELNSFLQAGLILTKEHGRLLVGWGKQQLHPKCGLMYAPDFFLSSNNPWITCEYWSEFSITELADLICDVAVDAVCWNKPDPSQFLQKFTDLQHRFTIGELSKAVPYAAENSSTAMTPPLLQNALHNLLRYAAAQPVYIYGTWNKGQGILGATPEVLFRQRNKRLETMACAGTRSVKSGNLEALLHDPKELHEHHVVVQGISEALTPYGKVTKGDIRLLPLPNLCHLLTPIHADLNEDVPFADLVSALHPTPALGAWPRLAGWEWLKRQGERGRYGAPIGYADPDSGAASCYVAIRNVQWNPSGMTIMAGCGVVPESKQESEWQEIQNKISAIKNMMGL